jgi:two-component system nitrogen regulation response regulator NtrX
MKARILIVDDEKNIRRTLAMILGGAGYTIREAESGETAQAMLAESPSEVVLLDVGLPGIDGIETLKRILAEPHAPSVIMISGQATVAMAVEATRLGAFDFLEKPLSKERVLIAVRNALRSARLGRDVQRFRSGEERRRVLVGESDAIVALRRMIEKVGPTGATVLVTGESGTGKEIVARALHDSSARAQGPFVKVNCAAIPEELIESELFGCVRGAYTGADRSRDGKFLVADGGTLFLDEIGDMSLRVQAKVLRALQEGEIERVGDSQSIHVDVRVIAATN